MPIRDIIALLPVLLCFFFAPGCSNLSPDEMPPASKFDDPMFRQIADFQDARNTNELLSFLSDDNPKYREEAAIAFGSIQDSAALPMLYELLSDESAAVKIAAAYAIGQTKDTTSSLVLIGAIEIEENTKVLSAELEALGKVITTENLDFFENFQPLDSLSKSGLAWGIYRAGLRGKYNDAIILKTSDLLDLSNSPSTRLGAAQFFGRVRNMNVNAVLEQLEKSVKLDSLAEVRMAVALGLRNFEDQADIISLLKGVLNDLDYRVRINTINAMSEDIFDLVKDDVVFSLNDENVNVGITAASYLGKSENPEWLYDLAKSQDKWRIRISLLNTAYNLAQGELEDEIESTFLQNFESSQNDYEKAWIVRSLSKNISSTNFLASQAFDSTNSRVIRSHAIQGLGQLRQRDEFSSDWDKRYAEIFQRAMRSGDLVMVFVSSNIFQNSDFNYKAYFTNTEWMTETRNTLDPIEDWEVIQHIDETIAFFNDEEFEEETQAHNSIDWAYFDTLVPNQQVVVATTKGDIILEMKMDQSPSSATNFLKLAAEGFYDGIYFHRVVPNFVMQGGCPRGDGWGGVNYAIGSEVGPARYKAGSVGMASSGKDTEGTQWFITHSPTPHLDGSYSIFAEVVKGMDVVNQIEVGDKIIKVSW